MQEAVLEGALLGNYDDSRYRNGLAHREINSFTLFSNDEDVKKISKRLELIKVGIDGNHLVRNFVNTSTDHMTAKNFMKKVSSEIDCIPSISMSLVKNIQSPGEFLSDVTQVKGLDNKGTGIIQLEYVPEDGTPKKTIVLVGVGTTGKSYCKQHGRIKQTVGQPELAGPAVLAATILAAAKLKSQVRIIGLIGLLDNTDERFFFDPGDVYMAGNKQVEVTNTDAASRLILADLLAIGSKIEADHLIDIGMISNDSSKIMGTSVSAVMGTDQKLVERILDAGTQVGESIWQLPLVEEYLEDLQSEVCDLRSHSESSEADLLTAGIFLRQFVGSVSWAHVELSSAWTKKEKYFKSSRATGEGPRWLLELICDR